MEDLTKLKISQTFNLPKQVKSILSFKNEKEENIIALGLSFDKFDTSEQRKEIYFFNITTNKEWEFTLYKNANNIPENENILSIDHLVFYLEESTKYLIASRCSYDPNLYVFDYKTGEILRRITVPRVECLLFKSFKYRGTRRFAYEVNKQDLNIIDFETSAIIVPINYQDFTPMEAKKIRFISNRLILILAGKKTNGHFVIRFLDIDSRQIILEHGLQNSIKESFYHILPLRNITKFCKIIMNFDNDEIESGMLCLKYNIDGTIISEKYSNDVNSNKKQRFLMKWTDNFYELIDLIDDGLNVMDFVSWKSKYTFKLGNNPMKLEKIKINNIYYLAVLFDDGNVILFTQKN